MDSERAVASRRSENQNALLFLAKPQAGGEIRKNESTIATAPVTTTRLVTIAVALVGLDPEGRVHVDLTNTTHSPSSYLLAHSSDSSRSCTRPSVLFWDNTKA